ncbi:transglycosylase SLT domain-containing protein [Leptolyngbya sp. FACHB-541]|uniref:lytic transglycosylase domain-containing protein n=1 Tax=Leptolyngbya sp. FACHB-541 TaxID=2692810 RepID=UPI0016821F95|nr:transglycosylase SLT domain-containing protein [Leptolyngbya sp. FACHB-541]MBD1996185.1 transglycosylase SLT domain-containing protein [Leptolyngbya sp. FACHB-541]
MLKQRKNQVFLAVGAGLAALTMGATFSASRLSDLVLEQPLVKQWFVTEQATGELDLSQDTTSAVLPLVSVSVTERAVQLEEIASGSPSPDRNRARYLLASDLIQQGQAGSALPWLEDLEQDYAALAPQILYKRAQAHTASGNPAAATAMWQQLWTEYPDDPVTAEALFALGQSDPQYWDQAIAKFPAHPRSIEIAKTRLSQDPNQLSMLLVLAKHGHYLPEITSILDRLVNEYGSQLQPEDWEAIAFAYWENGYYGSAGSAYAKAPRTSLNAYRTGRGAQLGERYSDALRAYYQLTQEFPDADETATALIKMAELTDKPQDALIYLDTVIERFPDRAAEALAERADVLEAMQSPESASQARQSILTQYSNSEAAAELRWKQAERAATAGDARTAWEWARQIVTENGDSELAPEAAYWVGKWAIQMGQQAEANKAFEYVLTHYPGSYYAWRAASTLGWDVGNFTTVRQQIPQVVKPISQPVPPAGSAALQELYRLGQYRDAWSIWQVEFDNPVQPTVAQQFTDGLMRLGVGDNLDGIFMVSSLEWREKPEEELEYQALKRQTGYWQALYPFPFLEPINSWSQQRQLNPMLVTALIRQESRFEPKIESVAGAVGLMQVMPDTADWVASQIGLQDYTMSDPNDNISLGTWYLDYTHREYDNNSLFAVASYNAGPGSVADWIDRFGFSDPDVFVEQIPFPETKGYVESVFENYWNYLRLYNPEVSQRLAQYSEEHAETVGFLPE